MKLIICLILLFCSIAQAKDCPGDMILWKDPRTGLSDCTCPAGQKMVRDLTTTSPNSYSSVNFSGTSNYNTGLYRFGKCQETFGLINNQLPIAIAPNNILLWLDADDPYGNGSRPLVGANVNPWVDKSGNNSHAYGSGNYLSPATYSATPANTAYVNYEQYTLNFASKCYSISSGPIMTTDITTTGLTVAMVVYTTSISYQAETVIQPFGIGGSLWYLNLVGSPGNGYQLSVPGASGLTNFTVSGSAYIPLNRFYIIIATFPTSNPKKVYLYGSGTTNPTIDTNINSAYTSWVGATALSLGSNSLQTSSYPLTGTYISEIMMYNTALSGSQVTSLANYLNNKWLIY